MDPIDTYSVSEFIELINEELGQIQAQVTGEISELKFPASGHAYFTLKDKDTGFILPCTIWARDYALSSLELEMGMEVAATGKANFYGPFGKLTFNAKTIELVGEGALKKAYEKLKKKLTLEGLFEPAKKRPIPNFPQKIGIITSLHGAVIHDFSNNLGKFGFKISMLNSKVEGPESGRELALSVRAMRTEDIDVLVIIRGGGSIQSLAGFDNEVLVREIASFPVPVIAGVGHHQDITLAALAADAAESTPSLVATLINRSWEQALLSLDRSEDQILSAYQDSLENTAGTLDSAFSSTKDFLKRIFDLYEKVTGTLGKAVLTMEYRFRSVSARIENDSKSVLKNFQASMETGLDYCATTPKRLHMLYQSHLQALSARLGSVSRVIQANSPERQLKFGYSIVYNNGKVVRSRSEVKEGETLELQVSDGKIMTKVVDNK